MTKRNALAWLLIGAAIVQLGCGASSQQDSKQPTYSVSQAVADELKAAGDRLQAKDWDGALALLDGLEQSKELNPYEHAMIWQLRAGAHLGQEHGEEVANDLEHALALHAMPDQQQQDASYGLGQTYLMLERFPDAIAVFEKWLERATGPKADELYVVATAYARAKHFDKALPYAQRAVAATKPPSEAMLRFLVSIYYELHQEENVAKILEQLTEQYPTNKEWWLQLAATYDVIHKRDEALAALKGAYDKGFLTEEKEILALANLYLKAGQPEQGALLIEKHIQDGKVSKGQGSLSMLAASWLAAKNADHAEAALLDAGDALTSGEPYIELARLEIARGQWAKARDALASGFAKGGLRDPGEAHLLLGAAHYHTKRKDAALASLTEAKKHGPTQRCAEVWLQIVRTGKEGADAACLNEGGQP